MTEGANRRLPLIANMLFFIQEYIFVFTFYSYYLGYVPSSRGFVPNPKDFVPKLIVLFVITILEGFVPFSAGCVSVIELFF